MKLRIVPDNVFSGKYMVQKKDWLSGWMMMNSLSFSTIKEAEQYIEAIRNSKTYQI